MGNTSSTLQPNTQFKQYRQPHTRPGQQTIPASLQNPASRHSRCSKQARASGLAGTERANTHSRSTRNTPRNFAALRGKAVERQRWKAAHLRPRFCERASWSCASRSYEYRYRYSYNCERGAHLRFCGPLMWVGAPSVSGWGLVCVSQAILSRICTARGQIAVARSSEIFPKALGTIVSYGRQSRKRKVRKLPALESGAWSRSESETADSPTLVLIGRVRRDLRGPLYLCM